nr:uncharacterized protein LOC112015717 [Quercus suber]
MVGSGPHQRESVGSQRRNPFVNLERRRDWEGSVHTVQFGKNHSQASALPLMTERIPVIDGGRGPHLISKSPFTHKIEVATLTRHFHQPTFTIYNGRIDPVEHVSHFNQRMPVCSKDEALMCKVFQSSLGLVAMRWFDNLRANSISSFKELTQAFGSRFVTCSRVPRLLASLLSLSMQEGETLKTYTDRYWEIFNEIDGDFDDVAISTFKVGLPAEHGLRKFLISKPVTSVR